VTVEHGSRGPTARSRPLCIDGGETVVQTASASVDHLKASLEAIGHEPMDNLRPDWVEDVVQRVVREPNELTVETAPFQSAI